jgi:hypothetical protein
MSETPDLVRHLYDHCVTTGGLTETDWQRFKRDHPMTPQQTEAVLVLVIQHLDRLTIALARRG